MNTQTLSEHYILPTYARFPIAFTEGRGSWLTDEDGHNYLDFCSGIAVCSLGHSPEVLVKAIASQASQLLHTSNLFHIRKQAELACFLSDVVVKHPGKCFFSNSGAEANDGLIKLARRYGHLRPAADGTPRGTILTFEHSFHGRTLGGIAATGQAKVKEGFAPLLPGFKHLPYNDIEAVREEVRTGQVVAIMIEAIQGEGGVHVAGGEFLAELAALAKENDILFFFDEIQCGLGRTGNWCGWRSLKGAEEIIPDGISWAKGMGGGFPVGGFWVADRDLGKDGLLGGLLGPGSHGSTYGGSPLASAAALAVLNAIHMDGLIANAVVQGKTLRAGVEAMGSAMVREVRGCGLILGVVLDAGEVATRYGSEEATPALAIVTRLMKAGLITVPAGPEVVRLLPPLNVSSAEVDKGLEVLSKILG